MNKRTAVTLTTAAGELITIATKDGRPAEGDYVTHQYGSYLPDGKILIVSRDIKAITLVGSIITEIQRNQAAELKEMKRQLAKAQQQLLQAQQQQLTLMKAQETRIKRAAQLRNYKQFGYSH